MDVLWRARSGRSATCHWQPADRLVAAQEFAGVSADSQQRALSGGEEEAVEDIAVGSDGGMGQRGSPSMNPPIHQSTNPPTHQPADPPSPVPVPDVISPD